MVRHVPSALASSLFCVCALAAAAQPVPSAKTAPQVAGPTQSISLGQSIIALNGPWRFQIGDSPADPATNKPLWAEPALDDSRWETVDLAPKPGKRDPFNGDSRYVGGWTTKGHPGYMGWAWYRMRLVLNKPQERLALEGPFWMEDGYQVFANGTLLGSFGKFGVQGKTPATYITQPAMFLLPAETVNGTGPVAITVAIRVWMGRPGFLHFPYAGGLHYAPLLGGERAIASQNLLDWHESIIANSWTPLEGAVLLLLGLLAASLILIDPSDRVYPWLAGVLFLSAGFDFLVNLGAAWTHRISSEFYFLFFQSVLLPLHMGGWVIVWWMWFRLRRPAWVPWAVGGLTLLYMILGVLAETILPGGTPHLFSGALWIGPAFTRMLFLALLVFIIRLGIRADGPAAWLVLPAVVPLAGLQFQTELNLLHMPVQWHPFGINFTIGNLANLVLAFSLSLLLLRRLLLSLARQKRMALDIKQAQEVQQVILPPAQTTVPGLTIESEYLPALEVGGDFFQILPHPSDGSLLIIAGDVTGKGLQAGMLVALLVGAIRSTAEWCTDPSVMLVGLNRLLHGRKDAYATCLALRIEADGSATLANAGHVPPYLNGQPMSIEGSLPLGLMDAPEFPVACFNLAVNDQLMLLSDGIAEATDANGKLFGFENVLELLRTTKVAAEVAAAGQRFGQLDDISVISVCRTPIPQPVMA